MGEFLAGGGFTRYYWQSSWTRSSGRRGATSSRTARAPRADAANGATATLAAVLRPMLAGMLSVLLVAGVIGLGVFLATDDPSAAPESTATTAAARDGRAATSTPTTADDLPPVKLKTLPAAAKAAGCRLQNPPDAGAEHAERKFTPADYDSNPPTSGTHFPTWYEDGVYASGTTPELGRLVTRSSTGASRSSTAPARPRRQSRGWSSSSTSSTAATTSCCSRTRRRCPTRSPRPPGATCSVARR